MRLSEFITANLESIMLEWEAFARTIGAGAKMNPHTLRDHAKEILLATVAEMNSAQSSSQTPDYSKKVSRTPGENTQLNSASESHAMGRLGLGFDLMEVVSEYRALRTSVLRLWRDSKPKPNEHHAQDVTHFNESIDQSLATAVSSYTKQVDQARDMFLAILGHDLRSPLSSIVMSAAILPHMITRDTDLRICTAQITSNAQVMGRMISDLLDYTRTRLGAGMPVSPTPMNLGHLCRELFKEFQSANPTREFRFESNGDFKGNWDSDRLRQMVSNLLGNAVQHGAPYTPINLKLNGVSQNVELHIHNCGPAILPSDLSKIFEPMVQGAANGKPKQNRPGSIGLGLYIAREIATSHGGRIDVTTSDDAGTTFIVHLPRNYLKADGAPILDAQDVDKLDLEEHD